MTPIRPRGRPKSIDADEKTFKQMQGCGQIQCTTREVAAVFGVNESTLFDFWNDYPDFKAAFEDGKELGKTSLRRSQFKIAEKNPTMSIFLGKNYLKQKDKFDHGHEFSLDWSSLTDDELPIAMKLMARQLGGSVIEAVEFSDADEQE